MRLTVLGPGHPFRGGIARTTTELVRSLAARGHEVDFLTPRRQYPGWLFPGRDDRDPDACERIEGARQVLDPLNPLSWAGTARRARALDADAWIVPYWTWAWSGLWWFLLRGRRPPTIAVVHNPADHDAATVHRIGAGLVLNRCEALFTHALYLEDRLAELGYGQPMASHPLPMTELPPLPDSNEARLAVGVQGEQRVVLFLGLIRPYKGVDVLLEAVSQLPADSDWSLIVAGEAWGDLGPAVERRAAKPDLADRVHLRLGWVPDGDIPMLLAAADLVVLPYRGGSQSAVAPTALAAGVPVLCTRVGGLPELVRDGVDGVLVEPGSAEALADALAKLDESSLARLRQGAESGRGRLTWDGYAAALECLIERVVC
jgi:glycosyltransferase involved in cell wall biosynthesis